MRSSLYASTIRRVLDASKSSRFTPSLTIFSDEDTTYTFTPLMINGLTISQVPSDLYMDDITIDIQLSPQEYGVLFDHAQGLMASLKLTFLDSSGSVIYNPAPKVRKYRAILTDPQDIRQKLRDANLHTTPQMSAKLRLLEKEAYELRTPKFSGTFKKETVEKAIRYIAVNAFKITDLYLSPPDNVHTYEHIVVPPAKGFDEVFDYLQSTYGVYAKGLEFYYTDRKLYIYPPFDKGQDQTNTATIYDAPGWEYAGNAGYHSETSGSLEIVATGESDSRDLTQINAENNGTSVMFMRSSQLVDGGTSTDTKGTKFDPSTAISLKLAENRTSTGRTNTTKFITATDNIYAAASDLAKANIKLVSTGWSQAIPFLLTPGHTVKYVCDKNGKIESSPALLESVTYQASRAANGPDGKPLFTCVATMVLRVEPPSQET